MYFSQHHLVSVCFSWSVEVFSEWSLFQLALLDVIQRASIGRCGCNLKQSCCNKMQLLSLPPDTLPSLHWAMHCWI